jgi:hypothetical protein
MEFEVKEHATMTAILIHLLQKHYPNKNEIFYKDHWRTNSTVYNQAMRVLFLPSNFASLTFYYYKLQAIKQHHIGVLFNIRILAASFGKANNPV